MTPPRVAGGSWIGSSLVAVGAAVVFTMSVVLGAFGAPASAQSNQVVILVLDLSGSMKEKSPNGQTKIDAAKAGLTTLVANLPDGVNVGFWVYGDQFASAAPATQQRKANCEGDARQVTPVGALDRAALTAQIAAFTAKGDTPVALALTRAAASIPPDALGTMILVSDGRDECHDADLDGDPSKGPSWGQGPCEVARQLKDAGVAVRLGRVETVGFLTDAETAEELQCIALATGGSFTPIEEAEQLAPKITEIVNAATRRVDRLPGSAVAGGASRDVAAPLTAGPNGAPVGRYTDSIPVNSDRWYRLKMAQDTLGWVSLTVFGLPAQEGITLRLSNALADGEVQPMQSREGAGLDRVGSDSVRETFQVFGSSDPEVDVAFVVRIESTQELPGTFDLELSIEGGPFGGGPIGCPEEARCWYDAKAATAQQQIDSLQEAIDESRADLGKAEQDLEDANEELSDARARRAASTCALAAQQDRAERFTSGLPQVIVAGVLLLLGLVVLVLSRRRPATPDPATAAVIGTLDAAPSSDPDPERSSIDATVVTTAPPPLPTVAIPTVRPDEADSSISWSPETVLEASTGSDSTDSAPGTPPPIPPAGPAPAEVAPEVDPASRAAGWFPDPHGAAPFRWWDGTMWTDRTADEPR